MANREFSRRETIVTGTVAAASGLGAGVLISSSDDTGPVELTATATVPPGSAILATIIEYLDGGGSNQDSVDLETGEQTHELSALNGDPDGEYQFDIQFETNAESPELEFPVVLEI